MKNAYTVGSEWDGKYSAEKNLTIVQVVPDTQGRTKWDMLVYYSPESNRLQTAYRNRADEQFKPLSEKWEKGLYRLFPDGTVYHVETVLADGSALMWWAEDDGSHRSRIIAAVNRSRYTKEGE